MPIVMLRLPKRITTDLPRPNACPYCGSSLLQRWGQAAKSLQDTQSRTTSVVRYRCNQCGRTFRHYPDGVDRGLQSQRIRQLAALAWAMGMSSRDVATVFNELGVSLSHMTVWRDGQEISRQLDESSNTLGRYTLDRYFLPGISKKLGVVLALDLGTGRSAILGTLNEYDPRRVIAWLKPQLRELNIQVELVATSMLNDLQLLNPKDGRVQG